VTPCVPTYFLDRLWGDFGEGEGWVVGEVSPEIGRCLPGIFRSGIECLQSRDTSLESSGESAVGILLRLMS